MTTPFPAWQAGQVLVLTGATGIGKSTRFPLTLAQSGRVLVVTPTIVGARVLNDYVHSLQIDYRAMAEVYQAVLERSLDESYDYWLIDDIQLARLEQTLLLLLWQAAGKRVVLAGLSLPAGTQKLLQQTPYWVEWPQRTYSTEVRYLDSDPLDDEARYREVRGTLDYMWQYLTGHVLLIAPTAHAATAYAAQLVRFRPLLVTEDNYLAEVFLPGIQKLIISTPVLESTVTIPDLEMVIDTMETRLPASRPNGHILLKRSWVSRVQAEQRRGRTGRTRSGLCVRLCSEETFRALPMHYPNEFEILGLTTVQLQWHLSGYDINLLPEEQRRQSWQELTKLGLLAPEARERAELVARIPFSIWPADLLARWILNRHEIEPGAIFAAIVEVGGPFLQAGDNADLVPRPSWAGASDFHTVVNLLTGPTPALAQADLVHEVFMLARLALRNLSVPLISDGPNGDSLPESLSLFQELLRRQYHFVIYSFDDALGEWVSAEGRRLLGNSLYPTTENNTIQAVLAVDRQTILLGLRLG